MREWQVGDPIGDGSDLGVPDIPYFDYLRDKSSDDEYDSVDQSHSCRKRVFTYDDYIKMAREFFDNGNYMDAIRYYDLALRKRYKDDAALAGKGECLHRLGQDEAASRCYFDIAYHHTCGSNEEKYIAIKNYKRCLELNPYDEEALDELGYSLKMLGRYSEALTYYNRIKNRNVDWEKAMCYMGLKEYQKAIPLLDNCINGAPHRDDWLDQKCECLIELNRKNEAVNEYKKFIDFLMSEECYERAIEKLDMLSGLIPGDDFIVDRRNKCLKNGELLNKRLQVILDVIASYPKDNSIFLDDNYLKDFIKYVSEKSGESIEDILRWYNTPMLDSFRFFNKCNDLWYYGYWSRLLNMNNSGKLKDL